MGTAKKEKSRKERQGKVGDGMANVKTKGENFYRYDLRHCRPWEMRNFKMVTDRLRPGLLKK